MSNGTTTPKDEDSEMLLSDISEANFNSFRSHDGLPREQHDEGYATQVYEEPERTIRSGARKLSTSQIHCRWY